MLSALKVPSVLVDGMSINVLIALPIAIVIVLAYFALGRKGIWTKLTVLGLAFVTLPAISLGMFEQLSHAKEISVAWLKAQGEAGVVIHKALIRPPKRIEILVEEQGEARLFSIPWDADLEKSLQEAMEKSQEGREGDLRLRMEPSLESKPQFYSTPWPAPAPKDQEDHRKVFKYQDI